jgi:hypothetical protein
VSVFITCNKTEIFNETFSTATKRCHRRKKRCNNGFTREMSLHIEPPWLTNLNSFKLPFGFAAPYLSKLVQIKAATS